MQKCNFQYVAMPMMTSQVLKFVDFKKTQKSRYLKNETFSFSNKKITLTTHQGLLNGKKYFCSRCNL